MVIPDVDYDGNPTFTECLERYLEARAYLRQARYGDEAAERELRAAAQELNRRVPLHYEWE